MFAVSIREPNELLNAWNKAGLSTDKPVVIAGAGVEDIETGGENLPGARSGSESTSKNK